jgi:hypothetical protein
MDDDEPSQRLTLQYHHNNASSSPLALAASSHTFDSMPDYHNIPFRRVKPLPKRKRSSPEPVPPRSSPTVPLIDNDDDDDDDDDEDEDDEDALLPHHHQHSILPPPPGPDATAEELIAHAEVLSAQVTFQSYFLPTLSGIPDFTRSSSITSTGGGGGRSSSSSVETTIETTTTTVNVLDDITLPTAKETLEGDQADQMQQQGNAKKRKVPAHLSGSQMGPDSADVHSAGEEELLLSGTENGSSFLINGGGGSDHFVSSSAEAAAAGVPEKDGRSSSGTEVEGRRPHRRRGKVLPATMIGLRQKEMLKHRRRQLAAALSIPPSLGDSLALDQALLANYALNGKLSSDMSRNARLKSRWVRRRASRVVRRHRTLAPLAARSEPTRRIFPDGKFTFMSLNTGVCL